MKNSVDIQDIQTPLIAQEIWLLEQYTSPAYCVKVVEAWGQMVAVAEAAYDDYMRHIPSNYRKREISEQVDVVWGNRVLPNFRSTLSYLQSAYIRILNGDLGLYGFGVYSDIRGSSDYWHEWMAEPALVARMGFNPLQEFYKQQEIARLQATNIQHTFGMTWNNGSLTGNLGANDRGYGITLPQEWPTYRLDSIFQCATGEPVPQHGIYLPAVANSCAQFLPLIKDYPNAVTASVGYDPVTGLVLSEEPTIWTLVKRVSDTGGGKVDVRIMTETETEASAQQPAYSAMPGQPCPRSGQWQTPAMVEPRSVRVEQGQGMPGPQTDAHGNAVVWFWRGA